MMSLDDPLVTIGACRLKQDLAHYASSAGQRTLPELSCMSSRHAEAIVANPSGAEAQAAAKAVHGITGSLGSLALSDDAAMLRGMEEAERVANAAPPEHKLAQVSDLPTYAVPRVASPSLSVRCASPWLAVDGRRPVLRRRSLLRCSWGCSCARVATISFSPSTRTCTATASPRSHTSSPQCRRAGCTSALPP